MDQKLLEKASKASSPQELAKLAHEAGIRLSDSDADRYFAEFHQSEKELSEEELSNVSGGSCDTAEELRKKYRETPGGAVCPKFELNYWDVFFDPDPDVKDCARCHHVIVDKEGNTYFCELQTL
jgi:predicted ribosomally synthesized peptide with nif11-like leader